MHNMTNTIALMLLAATLLLSGCQSQAPSGPATPTIQTGASVPKIAPGPLRQQAIDVIKSAFAGQQTIGHLYAAEVVADTGLKEFTPELRMLLKSDSMPVRFAAAMALGDLKYLPAKAAIEEALNDPDQNVRMAAMYARTRLVPDGKYVKQIYEGLSSTDQSIRANAALILGKLRDPSALTALYWVMSDKESSQDTRTQAAHSIALIGDEKIYSTLWTLLINSFANYRILGIEAMGALNDSRARSAVQTMLQDETLDVRLAAAEQLGVMKDPSGEEVVLQHLRNPVGAGEPLERERQNVRAARAIGSIGTAVLAEFLPQLMQNDSPIVRLAAAQSAIRLTQ